MKILGKKSNSFTLWLGGLLLIAGAVHGLAGGENSGTKKPPEEGRGDERTKDPIHILTGNNMYDVTDLHIPCPLIDLTFSRSYNSQLQVEGALGPRWCHSYDWRLYISPTSILLQAVVDLGLGAYRGDLQRFHKDETGTFYILGDKAYRLFDDGEGGFDLLVPGGLVRRFDANGMLRSINHPAGQSVALLYSGEYPTQKLVRVEHSNGQHLDFEYEDGLLTRVRTPSEAYFMSFSYDGLGAMTNASLHTTRGVFSEVYDYGADKGFKDFCLRRRVGRDGSEAFFDYEVSGDGASMCTGMHVGQDRHYEVKLVYALPRAELAPAGSVQGPFVTDIHSAIIGATTNAFP